MNIVIIAGGTGSIALQTGLHRLLDSRLDGFDTKVLVNAYDNGLSTGLVRTVMGGKILGPSDVRKNQTTRLSLDHPKSPWLKFLDIRFSSEASKAEEYCLGEVDNLAFTLQSSVHSARAIQLVREAISAYFDVPAAANIDYSDFSLANIVYAGFAKANGNSLRTAATIMAGILDIKDNVILNDDTSLFLGATTKNGVTVTDEGDIVSWGNTKDPFERVFFFDVNGQLTAPILCYEAADAIAKADLIILSTGTQWSSLIPTYASVGFKEAIERSSAKIVMIMNRQPDKDSPGQTGADIVANIVPQYFPKNRVHVMLDLGGAKQLNDITQDFGDNVASVQACHLTSDSEMPFGDTFSSKVHAPDSIANAVGRLYFGDYLNSNHFMFDYDDTLVGRGNTLPRSSNFNKLAIQRLHAVENGPTFSICTGNSIKAVNLTTPRAHVPPMKPLAVYADGGINLYDYVSPREFGSDDVTKQTLKECIGPDAVFSEDEVLMIIQALYANNIPPNKVENRGSVTISIKPITEEYRPIVFSLVEHILREGRYSIRASGRTTIDIAKFALSKATAVQHVLDSGNSPITFVGDEFKNGNDRPVAQMDNPLVRCLAVNSPAKTAFLFALLLGKEHLYV